MITPHRRPSDVIGTPTADPMPAAWDHRAMSPDAWEYVSILTGPPLEKTIDITFWPPSRTSVPSGTARPLLRQPTIAVTVGPSPYRPITTRSAESSCPASWATAASTVDGGSPCATSVATRRKAVCSSATRRKSAYTCALSSETASWPAISLTASERSAVNAPRMQSVLQQQHRLQPAAAEDRHGQQRAAVEVGEVRVAGEAVVVGGVGDDQRLTGALDVAQHRHRHRVLVAGAGDRGSAAGGCGQQPVVLVVAPQQQVDAGGAGHRAEHLDHPGVQPLEAGLRAQRLGGGQDAEQVERAGRDRRARPAEISRAGRGRDRRSCGPLVAESGWAQSSWATFAVAPQAAYCWRAWASRSWPAWSRPWARWKRAARSVISASVPRAPAAGDLAPGGVEGQGGGAEVADRPGPLGLEQPQQVQEVVRRVRGAGGQPARSRSSSSDSSVAALVTVGRCGPARPGPARAAAGPRRPGRRPRRPAAAASPPRCAAPGRPDRRRWRRRPRG